MYFLSEMLFSSTVPAFFDARLDILGTVFQPEQDKDMIQAWPSVLIAADKLFGRTC